MLPTATEESWQTAGALECGIVAFPKTGIFAAGDGGGGGLFLLKIAEVDESVVSVQTGPRYPRTKLFKE